MDYAQVLSQLFLGSHRQSTHDIDRLRLKAGITAVLNLQTDQDMRAVNLAWEPLEAYYRASAIELLRLPVRDFDPVDLREKLTECVRALDHLLATSHSVYLHCPAGAGRSPTVAIAYLHRCLSWDLDQAAAYVKERWECTPNIEAIQLAIWHPANWSTNPCHVSPNGERVLREFQWEVAGQVQAQSTLEERHKGLGAKIRILLDFCHADDGMDFHPSVVRLSV